MKAVIIDDELELILPIIGQYIQGQNLGLELIGSASDIDAGYELIINVKPDLVFLDVQIGAKTGFDLLRKFLNPSFIVIFVSSWEKYAVNAIRCGAIDFLPKPIVLEEFLEAVKKAHLLKKDQNYVKQLELTVSAYEELKQNRRPTRIGITDMEGTLFLEIDKIIHMDAAGINTIFCVKDEQKKIVSTRNIGTYADQFEAYPHFMKTHRAHIINLKAVKKYIRGDRVVRMSDNHEVQVALQNRDELLNRLNNL